MTRLLLKNRWLLIALMCAAAVTICCEGLQASINRSRGRFMESSELPTAPLSENESESEESRDDSEEEWMHQASARRRSRRRRYRACRRIWFACSLLPRASWYLLCRFINLLTIKSADAQTRFNDGSTRSSRPVNCLNSLLTRQQDKFFSVSSSKQNLMPIGEAIELETAGALLPICKVVFAEAESESVSGHRVELSKHLSHHDPSFDGLNGTGAVLLC